MNHVTLDRIELDDDIYFPSCPLEHR